MHAPFKQSMHSIIDTIKEQEVVMRLELYNKRRMNLG
jgi:hypothetical protein